MMKKLALCLMLSAAACSDDDTDTTTNGGATTNRERAMAALKGVFLDKDPAALTKYFAPNFIRHNPTAKSDGIAELQGALAGGFLNGVGYTQYRAFEQGDLAVVHSRYDNYPAMGVSSVVFDLFRFENGKIAEHWDCMQADPKVYASGNTMVDGPTAVNPAASTEASADVVVTPGKGFVPVVLVGGDFAKMPSYIGAYIQHDPLVENGLAGLSAATMKPPLDSMKFVSVHKSVADHDFVFVRSKGTMTWDAMKANSPNNPTVFCDLFRVANGKLEEHWDVVQLDPNSTDINALKTNGAGHTMWE